MTATSISMPDTAARIFVPDAYTVGLVTNNQYHLLTDLQLKKPLPAWQREVVARLAELERLSPNWDTEGALPLSRHHANRASSFLVQVMAPMAQTPEISPLSDGGVQLEWRLGDSLRIDFISDEEEQAGLLLVERDGALQEFPGQSGVEEAKRLLRQDCFVQH